MPVAPTVGVVIANHNNSDFIAKAIQSVARQTVRNIRAEMKIDAKKKVAAEFSSRTPMLRHLLEDNLDPVLRNRRRDAVAGDGILLGLKHGANLVRDDPDLLVIVNAAAADGQIRRAAAAALGEDAESTLAVSERRVEPDASHR